jgi:hypothetical protein
MRIGALTLAAALTLPMSSAILATQDEAKGGFDAEGYVTSWLVLAPIPLEAGQEGSDALGREQVKGEADLRPKPGEKAEAGGKTLAWKEGRTKDQVLDFNDLLGKQTEGSVGYAVAYLLADADVTDLTIKLGSDDQVKVYLNGKPIHSNDEGRELAKDEDVIAGLSLKKGTNVLVVKVVNEEEEWAVCARLVDGDGRPVKGVRSATRPE